MLRGHCPTIAKLYEDVMVKLNDLPCLNKYNTPEFHLPYSDSLSFHGYPMFPPEGYIISNFSCSIHIDRY
jgi:hypothetical protein